MNQVAIDIIIFAAIALFLFFKLRNVLGEVDENEKDAVKKSDTPASSKKTTKKPAANDRLARLNPQNMPGQWPTPLPDFKLVTNATAHNELVQLHSVAPKFDPYHFLNGAKNAFPMIVEAFSKGDKTTLKRLISEELYDLYEGIIDQRIENGETWQSEIVTLKSALISNADTGSDETTITVDFQGVEKITARDAKGNFIDDQDGDLEDTYNQWSFSKDLKSKDHIWILTKTESAGDL